MLNLTDHQLACLHHDRAMRDHAPPEPWSRARLRTKILKRAESHGILLDAPRTGDPDDIAALDGWLARMRAKDKAIKKAALDLDEEVAGYHLARFRPIRSIAAPLEPDLIDYWVQAEGLAFAFDAWWGALGCHLDTSKVVYNYRGSRLVPTSVEAIGLGRRQPDARHPLDAAVWGEESGDTSALRQLRRRIASADDETRAAVLDRITAARESTTRPSVRCALTYLVPDQHTWWREDAEALDALLDDAPGQDGDLPRYAGYLVLSAPDVEALSRALTRWIPADHWLGYVVSNQLGPTLVARLERPDRLTLVQALLTASHSASTRRSDLLGAACDMWWLLDDAEAVAALVEHAPHIRGYRQNEAVDYLERHAEVALPAVERALAVATTEDRDWLEQTLAHLQRTGVGDHTEVADIADLPDVFTEPVAAPMPRSWDSTTAPDVHLRGATEPLPLSALERIVDVLRAADGKRTADVEAIAAACEPADLAAFAWWLFESWQQWRWRKEDKFLMRAVGLFSEPGTATRLTPILAAFPSKSLFAHAVTGLEILRVIGGDEALLCIAELASNAKSSGLRSAATDALDLIARDQGLTGDALADRITPRLELAPAGQPTVLDYGPRQFHLTLAVDLHPQLTDPTTGKTRKSLPKPTASDDATLAAAAREHLKTVKKGIKQLADELLARFERAMLEQRRARRVATFARDVVDHPLLGTLARHLVWDAWDDAHTRLATFRVSDDGQLRDADDRPVELPDDARIGLVHPVTLTPAEIAAWSRHLVDQPFAQLERA